MNGYGSTHAGSYEVLYADKPYRQESEFVLQRLGAHGIEPPLKLLDVACGTGAHAVEFARLGCEVVGVDASEAMLEIGRSRQPEAGSLRLLHQDMRELDVPDLPFDVATCLFDSIGYAVTNAGLVASLKGIRRHLREGGLLVVEFWHAAAMLRSFDPVRVRRVRTPGGELLRISETTLRSAEQVADVRYELVELRDDGSYSRSLEEHSNRFFLVQEMAGWLTQCGFDPLEWHPGFDNGEVTGDTWHVVCVGRAT